jgi:signal transduction histidine kinase/ActR/RegA family two-component response regulator
MVTSRSVDGEARAASLSTGEEPSAEARVDDARLTPRLEEAQRLESLGLLAGGVAHDFNNLLTAILGMTQVVQGQLSAEHASQALLSRIVLCSERAAGLCALLLSHAGRHPVSHEPLDVAELVAQTADLLRASAAKRVTFDVRLERTALAVRADRTQLQQVVLNLVLNALEALPAVDGRVEVDVRRVPAHRVDFDGAVVVPENLDGPFIAIEVSDNGSGMAPSTLSRIFEPFFTTKVAGRGLGLAATLGILRAHGAGLVVKSAPDLGSAFTLYLPEATLRAAERVRPRAAVARRAPLRVLLVDDEPHVREAASLMLEAEGHAVRAVASGDRALAALDAEPSAFDVVLLDVTMPGLSGVETLALLRARAATLPVVLMSGFSERDVGDRAGSLGAQRFLQKPFDREQLAAALGRAMASASRLRHA